MRGRVVGHRRWGVMGAMGERGEWWTQSVWGSHQREAPEPRTNASEREIARRTCTDTAITPTPTPDPRIMPACLELNHSTLPFCLNLLASLSYTTI